MSPELEFAEEWLPALDWEGYYEVSNLGSRHLKLEGMSDRQLGETFGVSRRYINKIVNKQRRK